METNILVFGDSITWGAWGDQGGWVLRLKQYFDTKTLKGEDLFFLYNQGVSGDTTKDLLERFEFEAKQRLKEGFDEVICIFQVGSNDSTFMLNEKRHVVTLEDFKENISKLIELAKKFTTKIVFIEIAPIDKEKISSWDKNLSYDNDHIAMYNQDLKKACVESNVHLIPLFDEWIGSEYQEWLADGDHPNSEGHKKIFETVKEFLIKNNII